MKKLKIVSPISTKNSDSIELITMSLKNLNYDVYFFLDTNELFHMDKKDLDIILLEPDMNSWQWLNILIKANQILPDIPVVLFRSKQMQKMASFAYPTMQRYSFLTMLNC